MPPQRIFFLLLAPALLAGCVLDPFREPASEVVGTTFGFSVESGYSGVFVRWFEAMEPTRVGVSWQVEGGGQGGACVLPAGRVEAWLEENGRDPVPAGACEARAPTGLLRHRVEAGAWALLVVGYACPAFKCSVSFTTDAPGSQSLVQRIDRDDPWALA